MSLHDLLDRLQSSGFATTIAESTWMFPTIESIHVLSLALVVGSIVIVDLRLLGIASTGRPVTELTSEILPWTWGAFASAAVSGFLMFSSAAVSYFGNTPFRAKFLFMLLAGINMLIFQFATLRGISSWDSGRPVPLPSKVAGALSITFWLGVVVCGRWIGFTKI